MILQEQQRRNWEFWVESLKRAPPKPSRPLATEHQWGPPSPRLAALFTGDKMIPLSEFPAIDATLNVASALLLTLGYFFIRRKRIRESRLIRFACFRRLQPPRFFSSATSGTTLTRCDSLPRTRRRARFTLALLGSHTILAVVIVPLILTTLYRACRGRFERHKKLARWTLPLVMHSVVFFWQLHVPSDSSAKDAFIPSLP
jgi:putative membrane protein